MVPDQHREIYQCVRCGACCRWPGDVCLEEGEIDIIADFLKMDAAQFIGEFCQLRRNRQGLSLTEDTSGACIMLRDGGCLINPVKPQQCRDFPNTWNFPGWREQCRAVPVSNNHDAGDCAQP